MRKTSLSKMKKIRFWGTCAYGLPFTIVGVTYMGVIPPGSLRSKEWPRTHSCILESFVRSGLNLHRQHLSQCFPLWMCFHTCCTAKHSGSRDQAKVPVLYSVCYGSPVSSWASSSISPDLFSSSVKPFLSCRVIKNSNYNGWHSKINGRYTNY